MTKGIGEEQNHRKKPAAQIILAERRTSWFQETCRIDINAGLYGKALFGEKD